MPGRVALAGAVAGVGALPVYGNDGQPLNNPVEPYWPHYEGDEDTRRKPAYHNGTAWTWTLPIFCEALARAWDFAPDAVAAAKAYLGSMERLMNEGCLGQIPKFWTAMRRIPSVAAMRRPGARPKPCASGNCLLVV